MIKHFFYLITFLSQLLIVCRFFSWNLLFREKWLFREKMLFHEKSLFCEKSLFREKIVVLRKNHHLAKKSLFSPNCYFYEKIVISRKNRVKGVFFLKKWNQKLATLSLKTLNPNYPNYQSTKLEAPAIPSVFHRSISFDRSIVRPSVRPDPDPIRTFATRNQTGCQISNTKKVPNI